MAEVNTGGGGGGKHEKKRAKKSSTRIDMTPMVDLAFLLLTFFVLTSTFAKPKTLEINYPADPKDEKDRIKVTNALTFILTEKDKDGTAQAYYYYGEFFAEGMENKEGNRSDVAIDDMTLQFNSELSTIDSDFSLTFTLD